MFKDEFEGFKLYVTGSGQIIPYSGQIDKPLDEPRPVPAYGVPMPPKDDKKVRFLLMGFLFRLKTRRKKKD